MIAEAALSLAQIVAGGFLGYLSLSLYDLMDAFPFTKRKDQTKGG